MKLFSIFLISKESDFPKATYKKNKRKIGREEKSGIGRKEKAI